MRSLSGFTHLSEREEIKRFSGKPAKSAHRKLQLLKASNFNLHLNFAWDSLDVGLPQKALAVGNRELENEKWLPAYLRV